MNASDNPKQGFVKVYLNGGKFAEVSIDELSQFLIDNEHLTNNTQRCLRKRVLKYARKKEAEFL